MDPLIESMTKNHGTVLGDSRKTLLLGGSGFLGRYFSISLTTDFVSQATSYSNFSDNIADERIVLEIRTENDLDTLLNSHDFDRVINCVALANLDECQLNPEKANWINWKMPGILARKCFERGLQFAHISTDAIFDGINAPYSETAHPHPISVYGMTKLLGESSVLTENPNSYVFRVNFFGNSLRGESLFNYFYSGIKAGRSMTGYDDVFFTSLYGLDTASIAIELMDYSPPGIYNIVGSERISKYEFGLRIGLRLGAKPNWLRKGSIGTSDSSLIRSKDLSLDNSKIASLGIVIPSLDVGLDKLLREMDGAEHDDY